MCSIFVGSEVVWSGLYQKFIGSEFTHLFNWEIIVICHNLGHHNLHIPMHWIKWTDFDVFNDIFKRCHTLLLGTKMFYHFPNLESETVDKVQSWEKDQAAALLKPFTMRSIIFLAFSFLQIRPGPFLLVYYSLKNWPYLPQWWLRPWSTYITFPYR